MSTVCIESLEAGGYEVYPKGESYPEPAGGEMGQADMAEDAKEGAQTFQSIDEALQAAKAMLSGGQEAAPMIPGEKETVDSFAQGFKSVRGSPDEQMMAGRRA